MNRRSEPPPDWNSQRMKIIGLGESSIRKSYYPELQQRILELEEKNRELEKAYADQTAVSEELRQQIDETARKEQELRRSEERFRNLIDSSPVPIYLARDGRLMYANLAFCHLIGYDLPADITGKELLDFVAPEFHEKVGGYIRARDRGEDAERHYESVGMHRDGSRFPYEISVAVIGLSDGPVTMGFVTDISERKRAEEAIARSENKYRGIVETTPDVIWETDIDGRFTFLSPGISDLLGYRAEDLIGRTFLSLLPPDQSSIARDVFEQHRADAHGLVTIELVAMHADGHRCDMEIRSRPAIDERGMLAGFRGITRNITESRRTAVSLDQARKKLNLLNTVTFQDIQNAAFSLSAYHILIDRDLKERSATSSFLEKESVLIRKIIASLEFAKNFQDMGINPPRWQNVTQTFLYAISHLDFLQISHDLRLDNLEVWADPLFEHALYSLMENVLRHGKTASAVRAWYEEHSDGLVLIVEDNGIGIPREEKQIIFDRGYGKDTGLGLFLAREILSITGMSIRETGEFGRGARFEIHIPQEGYRIYREPDRDRASTGQKNL